MFTVFLRHLPIAVLVLIAFGAFPTVTSASHSWAGYHWARTSNPFTVKLGNNVSSAWYGYSGNPFETTSYDWSLSSVLETTIVAGQGGSPKRCRATSGRVEVCSSTYGKTGWLGVASIWASGKHITQGTVKVNDTYFNTSTYNTPAWRNLVMCQEVGHALGLDHQDEDFNNPNLGTCMDYTDNPSTNQHPNQHDYDELVTIYSHLDSTTTVSQTTSPSQMPPAMNDIDFATPAQWGKLIRTSNAGRTELYELDFGGGHKVFTFVTWADGEERGRR